jgi:hypothetical protein
MNHKILEQIKGGGFLAGDLPMSTSSSILGIVTSISIAQIVKNKMFHLKLNESKTKKVKL